MANSLSPQNEKDVESGPDLCSTLYAEPAELQGQDISNQADHSGLERLSCPVCNMTCSRLQDVKRHMLTHLPPWLQCPEVGCGWRGDHSGNLRGHRTVFHTPGAHEADIEESVIYDPWPLVEGILKGEITHENARLMAISMVEKFASKSRKLGLLGDFWGHQLKKANLAKTPSRKVHGDKYLVPKEGHDDGSVSGANQ